MNINQIIKKVEVLPKGEDVYLDGGRSQNAYCGHECTALTTDELKELAAA